VIVRHVQESIQLITQPDHAHLARAIMDRCVPLAGRPRRASILLAIGEHDNGWTEEDAAPMLLSGSGEIADFVHLPLERRHAVWPRGVWRLAGRGPDGPGTGGHGDRWAAALVAQHAVTVYDRFRPDPAWTAFFAGMTEARDALLADCGEPLDELLADYPFLRLGDLISLAFCTGAAAEQRFGDWTVQLRGTSVVVAPDPFGGKTIPIEIAARVLAARAFRDDGDLRGEIAAADAGEVRRRCRPGAPSSTFLRVCENLVDRGQASVVFNL
jgi:hypothetical protein